MSAFMQFEVYGKAQPQGSARAFVNKKTGKVAVTSANPGLRDWRDLVAREAREQMHGLPPLETSVRLGLVFWLARPRSVKRDEPTVKPDLDKLQRAVLDALTGIVYRDDAQVVHIEADKRYCDHAVVNPCVAVTVKGTD